MKFSIFSEKNTQSDTFVRNFKIQVKVYIKSSHLLNQWNLQEGIIKAAIYFNDRWTRLF